jgi:gliding motility-associated-like protein
LFKISCLKSLCLILAKRYTLLSLLFFCNGALAQLEFVENKGQWEKQIDYKSTISNGAFYLHPTGFTVVLQDTADLKAFFEIVHGHPFYSKEHEASLANRPMTIKHHAYRVKFVNAQQPTAIIPDKKQIDYNNYFLGEDSSKWKSNCRLFQAVTYQNIYPGIDVRYYTDMGMLKYDFIVRPGGNPASIVLEYEGTDGLSVKNEELIIKTTVGNVRELYPYTYQSNGKGRQKVSCSYSISKNRVRFNLAEYDPAATLVIDPTLIFSTFVGSREESWGYTSTPGPDGTFFGGGISFSGGFPVSPGAFSVNYNGGGQEDGFTGYDVGLIKLSADGRNRMYCTYLGGSANEQPHSLIVDNAGNLVVAGRTNSANFPKRAGLVGSGGAYDIFVTKFNAAGSALIGSIVVGGNANDGVNIQNKFSPLGLPGQNDGAFDTRRNYGDDARSEVILGADNSVFLASCTQSSNFPVSATGIQTTFAGSGNSRYKQDGVIIRFTPNLSNVLFSTFFGGNGNDACFVLSINPVTGNLFVAGSTTSTDLPGDKTGVLHSTFQGGAVDGFVTEVLPNGASIVRTTYIGTNDGNTTTDGNDMVYGLKFDKFGFPYICGTTAGANWRIENSAFGIAGAKQFIAKMQPNLSGYIYTTTYGSNSQIPNLSLTAFLVDRCQNVYVAGWGAGFNNDKGYPCAGTSALTPLVTLGAVKSSTDGDDFFFFVLERDGDSQLYGSFFGQNGGFDDHVDGGTSRFDENGVIYHAVCANCSNSNFPGVIFPTTPGVWSPTNPSTNCNIAMMKIEMNFGGLGASINASINGVIDTVGCVPLTIRFTDTLNLGKRYIWNFGDGTPEVETLEPENFAEHEYTNVGRYTVRLIAIDSTTCNIADTAFITVRVGNNTVQPSFIATKTGGCQSLTFRFDNTSTAINPVFNNQSFVWDFGDNSPTVRSGLQPVLHTYASAGTYNVRLIVDDTNFCNAPDTTERMVRLAVNVDARFETPTRGCVPYNAIFNNTSQGGLDFEWNFGDGSPISTDVSPQHVYNNPGTYNVRLIAIDTTTCNQRDTTFGTIQVFGIPTANFDFNPNPPQENRAVNFNNLSIGADNFLWDFEEGQSTERNPRFLFNVAKTYNVCLVAINLAGCSDTICLPVTALVVPLLDVPNAFTPGKNGINSVIKVAGFGIAKMDWRIYNRWGQLVFQSSDRNSGWDGTFKGVMQPLDVYTYTLDVTFTDEKRVRKTGDITLLR